MCDMEVNYKNHVIDHFGYPMTFSNKWGAKVIISWEKNGLRKMHSFDGPPKGFSSLLKAESWGLQFRKKWIDDGKPAFSK